MKRLILRIAALGTVVVLGLIAIAQAQRGSDASSVPSEENPLRPAAARAADGAEPRRIASVTEGASPLREAAPPGTAENPLRPDARLTSATIEAPPSRLETEPSPLRSAAGPTPTEQPSPALGDPFGLRNQPGAETDDPRAGLATAEPSNIPDGPSLATGDPRAAAEPRTAPGDRFPGPLDTAGSSRGDLATTRPPAGPSSEGFGPPSSGSLGGELMAAAPPVGHPLRDAPGETLREVPPAEALGSVPNEPAPFEMDPATGGSSIPTSLPPGTGQPGLAEPETGANALAGPLGGMDEASGQPGAKHLEGPQSPQITVQKTAPAEIQVGKPAVFQVTVRNTGPVAAGGVQVRDRVPKGTRLVATKPQASLGARGELVWELGTLEPGGESTVEMQLMPTAEGEIGSVATVVFSADASVRTTCTKPELVLTASTADKVLIGEQLTLKIEISNPGSGAATGVVLAEHVPAGLRHPAGADLEYDVGTLKPGESRKLELVLDAVRAGTAANLLVARAEGNLMVEDRLDVEVVAPSLDLALNGPKRRFLEREAVYEVSVHNPGTAAAEQVELVAYLPPGLQFVSANNQGHYDAANRAVFWRLAELPVNETGTVELVTMPVQAGQQKIRLRSTAEKGVQAEQEHPVVIEGIAAIMFEVADVSDPVGVGGETTYEIRVVNQGTKAAGNVRLAVDLPPELRPVAAEGPTRNALEGNRVLFEPLARLAPKADTTYRVRARAMRPGDLRVRVQVLTDDLQSPVVKEESTRVYSDE